MIALDDEDALYFGPLPPEVDRLLQQGVAAHFDDPARAEAHFREAVALAPDAMPAHRCLFKHYNRKRQFEQAHACVLEWLQQASRKTGLPGDWRDWLAACGNGPARGEAALALPALKALAFIQLRRDRSGESLEVLASLRTLDPEDGVGWSVVESLLPELESA